MKRCSYIIFALILLSQTSATAEELGKTERSVLGWTGTGQEIAVRLKARGERMVDGASQDYYFEATEMYRARDGELIQRYRHGEAVGASHPEFEEAKRAELAAKYLENVGLREATESWQSPTEKHLLHIYRSERIDAAKGAPGYQCFLRERVLLMDANAEKLFVVSDDELRGRVVSRRGDATCPDTTWKAYWDPGGKKWAATRTRDAADDDWLLKTGSTDVTESYPEAFFSPVARNFIATLDTGEENPFVPAWMALFGGDIAEARKRFEQALARKPNDVQGQFGKAMALAWSGESKKAQALARNAYRASEKGPWERALRAAVYSIAGETKRAERDLQRAIKKAPDYETLLAMGYVFFPIDVKAANQLIVHGLSHPSAEGKDTTRAYELLMRGLVDAGDYSKASELLGKLEEPGWRARISQIRIDLDRGETKDAMTAARALLDENPGRCEAYLLLGRALADDGRPADAYRHFRAAAFCDPYLAEPLFLLGDIDRAAGRVEAAKDHLTRYREIAPRREGDEIRKLRRERVDELLQRFEHKGVVLLGARCRRLGGAYLCQGTVKNTAEKPMEMLSVQVVGKKGDALGEYVIDALPAGETKPFGVRVQNGDLEGAVVTTGRTDKERELNAIPARL